MNCQEKQLYPADYSIIDAQERESLLERMELTQFLAARESFRVGQAQLHCEFYEAGADKPLIVFRRGIGTYCEIYGEFLSGVTQKGFNVAGIDPLGHGYSPGERGKYTVEEMTPALQSALSALEGRHNGEITVYGYSIGAVQGLAWAEADSRIQRLICGTLLLTEEAPDLFHSLGWTWTWSTAQIFPWMRLPLRSFVDFDELMKDQKLGELINEDPLIIFDYPVSTLASLFTHRSHSVEQQFPFKLTILQGDEDEVLPLAYAQRVVQRLEQPAELSIITGQGHMLPWDDPQELAQRVMEIATASN